MVFGGPGQHCAPVFGLHMVAREAPPLLRRVSRCALSQTLVPANGLALLGCVPGLCFRDYWFIVSNEEQIVPVTLWFI